MTRDREIQETADKFMRLLNIDLHEALGADVPFMIKLEIHMAADQSVKDKLIAYQEKIKNIMDRMPKEYDFKGNSETKE